MRTLGAVALAIVLPACAAVRIPALPGPAAAVQDDDWSDATYYRPAGEWGREGGYAGVSVAYSFERFDDFPITFLGTPVSSTVGNSVGLGVRGGYRFKGNVAVEATVERMFGYELKARLPSGSDVSEDVETVNAVIQGKYFLGSDKVQPFVLAGFGWTRAEFGDLSESGAMFRFGAGSEFWLDRDTALFVEATWNTGGEIEGIDLDHADLQVGVVVRF